jgi:hypothetical protein
VELVLRPEGDDDHQPLVGLRASHQHPAVAGIQLHIATLQAAPVRVVGAGEARPRVVTGRFHRSRDEGVASVGSYDDARALDDLAAADPDHRSVLEHELVDRVPGANYGAGFGSCLDEQRVEYRAARRVAVPGTVARWRRAPERERAESRSSRQRNS